MNIQTKDNSYEGESTKVQNEGQPSDSYKGWQVALIGFTTEYVREIMFNIFEEEFQQDVLFIRKNKCIPREIRKQLDKTPAGVLVLESEAKFSDKENILSIAKEYNLRVIIGTKIELESSSRLHSYSDFEASLFEEDADLMIGVSVKGINITKNRFGPSGKIGSDQMFSMLNVV